jgi:1-acyl-sn-glycerol-3-phosphate acyltransferase
MSYLDPPVLDIALKRRATYMAKEELLKAPFIGTFVRSFSLPVRRGNPQPSTIKDAVRRLKHGEAIVIFPEGGISADGTTLDAKRGIGVIAAMSRVPVVPAHITGTERALPVGAKILRPAKITVAFGRPIMADSHETERQFQDRVRGDIMRDIRKLKGQGPG